VLADLLREAAKDLMGPSFAARNPT